MKKTILFAVLISLVLAGLSSAQVMRCYPKNGHTFLRGGESTARTDSTSFYQRYYFDIPEGMETDTLQLALWLYSSDGTPHVKIYYHYAMRLAPMWDNVGDIDEKIVGRISRQGTNKGPADTHYKLGQDSVAISTDWSTEGMTSHVVVGAAKDTLENAHTGMKIWPDAICVAVTGTTNNRADTEYSIKLIGRKGEQTLR